MRRPDSPEDIALLRVFLEESCRRGLSQDLPVTPCLDVTVLMYFFWRPEVADEKWPEFEGALLETWRNCGLLKTVLVVDSPHRCVMNFSERYKNVSVQVENRLVPGDINTMSFDCNARLYSRFESKYVLIVQNDGFPIRPGLDAFVKKGYDFYGAPHCRPQLIPDILTRLCRYCPSNGGFSLRTRKLCKLASRQWIDGRYEERPFVEDIMAEDYFYTKTLPRISIRAWMSRSQAPSNLSDSFSYGAAFPLSATEIPFGFHTATGFAAIVKRFGDELAESLMS